MRRWFLAVLVSCAAGVAPAAAQPVDHSAWDALLRAHVNEQGLVNYPGVQSERAALEGYLAQVAAGQPASMANNEQLAFWINAYNAAVFKGVLDHWPLTSVRDVKGFFDGITYPVAGQELTLNQIEEQGRKLGDWKIHFGVVCASSSCPYLRNEAYAPERAQAQLEDQTRKFLADELRGMKVDGGTLRLSKIFKWYAKDFVPKGEVTPLTLLPLLNPHLPPAVAGAAPSLRKLKYMDYDWSLNAQ